MLFFPIEARKVLPVQCQQQKMINSKVFHLSIKKILSLFPVFHLFNAATEIPHGRLVSSNKNRPVKSPFPNEMGLSIKVFSKDIVTDSLSYQYWQYASYWFAIKVVTISLGNLVTSIGSWHPYGWTNAWHSVRFVQHSLILLPPATAAFLRM